MNKDEVLSIILGTLVGVFLGFTALFLFSGCASQSNFPHHDYSQYNRCYPKCGESGFRN